MIPESPLPSPLFYGKEENPILVLSDPFIYADYHFVTKELGLVLESENLYRNIEGTEKFSSFLYQEWILPNLREVFSEKADFFTVSPSVRCLFMDFPKRSSIMKCSVFSRSLIEKRQILMVSEEAHSQLGIKASYDIGRLINDKKFGVVLMIGSLQSLWTTPKVTVNALRAMEIVGL